MCIDECTHTRIAVVRSALWHEYKSLELTNWMNYDRNFWNRTRTRTHIINSMALPMAVATWKWCADENAPISAIDCIANKACVCCMNQTHFNAIGRKTVAPRSPRKQWLFLIQNQEFLPMCYFYDGPSKNRWFSTVFVCVVAFCMFCFSFRPN